MLHPLLLLLFFLINHFSCGGNARLIGCLESERERLSLTSKRVLKILKTGFHHGKEATAANGGGYTVIIQLELF
ncbi:hypothetical protein ACFX2C_028569 [Malus domestica]